MRQYTVGWHVCVNESSLELFGLMVVPSRSETIDAFPCYNVHPPDAVTEVAYAETQHVCVRPRGVVNKKSFFPECPNDMPASPDFLLGRFHRSAICQDRFDLYYSCSPSTMRMSGDRWERSTCWG